jgi:hypothetical protein
MNYKILMDGAIPGHNAGDIIDLSESDGNSLAQWGIVEISKDVAPTTTAPDVAPPPAPPAPVSEPTKAVEAPVPDKVEAATATAATDTGSTTEAKAKASAK